MIKFSLGIGMQELPDELWLMILSHVCHPRYKVVCKKWNSILQDPQIGEIQRGLDICRQIKLFGTVKTWWHTGALYIYTEYNELGEIHGKRLFYYQTGELHKSYEYKRGQYDGLCMFFNEKGEMVERGHFQEGELHGTYAWYKNNEIILEHIYNKGKYIISGFYKGGRLTKVEKERAEYEAPFCPLIKSVDITLNGIVMRSYEAPISKKKIPGPDKNLTN